MAALLAGTLLTGSVDTKPATFVTPAHIAGPNYAMLRGIAQSAMQPSNPIGPTADQARDYNSRVPTVLTGLVRAAPFTLPASEGDWLRAIDCLAAAVLYEAGSAAADQRAVAQVVLNRVRHPAFPKTVCGVIFQGSERSTGCQFTFTCDGALWRRKLGATEWSSARQTAAEMLAGRVEAVVSQATHYHTNWVSPVWDRSMDKIAVVKTHLFYRWRGAFGSPSAFTGQYAGSEPNIPTLARISAMHRAGNPLPFAAELPQPQLFASVDAPQVAPPVGFPIGDRLPDRASVPDSDVFLVSLPVGAGADSFVALATQTCSGLRQCRFIGWTDATRKASKLPLSGRAVDAISFTFVRKSLTGPGRAQWNCTEFMRADAAECMRRGT